jgi:non-reducing end alpha-L-arabinofuranosidase
VLGSSDRLKENDGLSVENDFAIVHPLMPRPISSQLPDPKLRPSPERPNGGMQIPVGMIPPPGQVVVVYVFPAVNSVRLGHKNMKKTIALAGKVSLLCTVLAATMAMAQQAPAVSPQRPQGPCDIYGAAENPCVAAHSTTRALYAAYNGPLYQVLRQSDGRTLDIGVVPGDYADAAAQDKFCADTYCWISIIYDQSPKHNDLTQAPRGGFSGPSLGGFNNLPIADMAPVAIMGHKVYGAFIEPNMGLRHDDVKGTAVDDQAEGQYWVVSGKHYNAGCCFDYGNGEIDSRDDDNGTMETLYFGNATPWFSGAGHGPWIMTDQENNLVGCVNQDGTKGCPNLPSLPWRFVTAIAKGEPHHWASLGGDAQKGALTVMFDGVRVNSTYDPMRKQGAILLGNGGDNSVGSQGTFYEGAMTAAGTFPSNATDQLVQANIVAAGYDVAPLVVSSASKGVQTFAPHSSQEVTVTFTNTTGGPAGEVSLSLAVPSGWTTTGIGKTIAQQIAPGSVFGARFRVTSGPEAFNGDVAAKASWTSPAGGTKQEETAVLKVRTAIPVKINEFRVSSGAPANRTNSFIELYNAGSASADISKWTLTVHPARQAIFSAVTIPDGTKLAAGGFYLAGLANSGLAAPARAGDTTLHLRSTVGMSVGDTVTVGSGPGETRRIATLGTPATNHTTLWQPLPEGPVITIPAGSTNVPVESTAGFVAGQKIALGYGSIYPVAANGLEKYEIATVTAVGKAGTQGYLVMDAPAGATNLKVMSLSDISVGDKIRLDVDSVDHGIETVTVTHVGTAATKTNLSEVASAGTTRISVRSAEGFAAGDKIMVGTPVSQEPVTVTAVGSQTPATLDVTPALGKNHGVSEWVVAPGTGLDLAAPLQFHHAANLPFSNRGTGISFEPATAFAHASNEPVQALGSGITLDKPLANDQAIFEAVHDDAAKTAGYQGPAPNQWFGGPEFTTTAPQFGHDMTIEEGSILLRDASGMVADSLNYGSLVDPWAAEGDQSIAGAEQSGCFAPAPGAVFSPWSTVVTPVATNASAGRFPDGADSDSNCNDFKTQAVATLPVDTSAGATNIKVTGMEGFRPGQKILMDAGANLETAVIATVGTAGATTLRAPTSVGATILPAANVTGFRLRQTILIGQGGGAETAVVSAVRGRGGATLTLSAPLARAHAAGEPIAGSGLTLNAPLAKTHASGTQVSDHVPTPGAPNQYQQ